MNDSMYDRSNRSDELFAQLVAQQRKLLLHSRLATLFSLLLCAVLIAGFFSLAAPIRSELRHVESSLTEIDRLTADAGVLIDNANTMVEGSTDAVTDAVQKLNEVDIESLNEAIQNLSDATVPLANLANLFR